MTDFALKVIQTSNINEAICWEQTENRLDKIYQYALFLKKSLTIGMFITYDENGKVLQLPEKYKNWINYNYSGTDIGFEDEKKCREYDKAKSRVIFEGFEILEYPEAKQDEVSKVVKFKNCYAFHYQNEKWNLGIGLKTIEDLIPYGLFFYQNEICYKSNQPCKFKCNGLCRESC